MAQDKFVQQAFVIHRPRVIDNEKIFTEHEEKQLDSIMHHCRKQGIADIAIVTIDDRHTNKEDFDKYVLDHLIGYALGEYGKNNGIVIAISKKLRQMRVENGVGIEKVLSNEATKKIIDEQFIPKFKEGDYFEGTLNGLNTIIDCVGELFQGEHYTDVSAIFRPAVFQDIRTFILENGTPQTFRELDHDNPSYNFTSLDVFLGPSNCSSFILKDFYDEQYYEMTIRDSDGRCEQFVYFDDRPSQETHIQQDMKPQRVYWVNPGAKLVSQDVWPLLAQIEDEMAQHTVAKDTTPFTRYQWVLSKEFHPMERIYTDVKDHDTLAFSGDDVLINGEQVGVFKVDKEERSLVLTMNDGIRPVFAVFSMENHYYYQYLFNKPEGKLYLVPLDEREGKDLVCVEGCTLLFELFDGIKGR